MNAPLVGSGGPPKNVKIHPGHFKPKELDCNKKTNFEQDSPFKSAGYIENNYPK